MASVSNKSNSKKFYEVVLKFQFNTISSYIFSDYDLALDKEKQLKKELMNISPLERRYYDLHIYERTEGSERRDGIKLDLSKSSLYNPKQAIKKAKEKLKKQGVKFV